MLEGRLGDFTLPDILRLLAFTAKSGRLWLSEGGVTARVDVLEGRVRDATADTGQLALARRLLGQDLVDPDTLTGALEPLEAMPADLELARRLVEMEALDAGLLADVAREQAVDALFDLLRWPEGAFRFEAGAAPGSGPSVLDLALPVDEVLDEVGRRLEAHEAIRQRTGDADAVVTISRPGRERAEVGLSPEGWTLLALVDGHRTVGDLVRLSGQGDYRTRGTLAALMDEGIVTVGVSSELPPAERLVAAHRSLAEQEARLGGAAAPVEPSAPAPGEPREEPTAPREEPRGTPHESPGTPDESSGASDGLSEVVAALDAGADGDAEHPPADRAPGQAPAAQAVPDRAPAESAAGEAPRPAAGNGAGEPGPRSEVTPLRARVRHPELRTDPDVDEDLVRRLIDGVEGL